MIKKTLLIYLLLLFSFLQAKSYTLYLASVNSVDLAREHYEKVRFHTPEAYNVIINKEDENNYNVIITEIATKKQAKKIQSFFNLLKKYPNSHIKIFNKILKNNVIENKKLIAEVEQNGKDNEQKYQENKNIEETNEYKSALQMYNSKKYQEAYTLFYKLFLRNNYNLNINYFLARSAFSIKRFDESLAAYERALIIKPDFNQARYDYARILYKLKIKKEAKNEFNKLLKTKMDDKTKTKIKEYLKFLDIKKSKKNISAKVMIGISSSSNVNNGLDNIGYRLPGLGSIQVTGEEPISDSASSQMINLNIFKYLEKQPIRLKNSFSLYNKVFFNEKSENIRVVSYKPSLTYLNKKNSRIYNLEFAIDKIIKENDEDFYAFSLSPRISTKNFMSYFKYQKVFYVDSTDKDNEFEKIQFYGKLNLLRNMNFYTNINRTSRIYDLRNDIDNITFGNGINIFFDITNKNRINLNYEFDYSKYKYKNIGFNSIRKDKKHLIELSLIHKLNKDSIIHFSANHRNNKSNQDAYIFNENEVQINYLKEFFW